MQDVCDSVRDMRLVAGQAIGEFVIEGFLGEGGTSEVYQVLLDGRPAALKILKEALRPLVVHQMRLVNEFACLQHLCIPGVVRSFAEGDYEGRPYYVMEWLPTSLTTRLRQSLPPAQIVPTIVTLAHTLAALHAQGIVHRDVKPSNVLFAADGSQRLTDFGHAKLPIGPIEGLPHSTETGSFLGTREYAAPEQLLNAKAVDGRADVYALGVVLFEALAGHRPFDGSTAALRMTYRAPRVSSPHARLSRPLVLLVAELLNPVPEHRPSAAQVAARLERMPWTTPQAPTPWRWLTLCALPLLTSMHSGASISSRLTSPPPEQRLDHKMLHDFQRTLDEQSLEEARDQLAAVASQGAVLSLADRARVQQKQADLDRERGRLCQAQAGYAEAVASYRSAGQQKQLGDSLNRLADLAVHLGDLDTAKQHYEDAEQRRRVQADRQENAPRENYFSQERFGLLYIEQGHVLKARSALRNALELAKEPVYWARTAERLASLPNEPDAKSLVQAALQRLYDARKAQPHSRRLQHILWRSELRLALLTGDKPAMDQVIDEAVRTCLGEPARGLVAHEVLELLMLALSQHPQQAAWRQGAHQILGQIERLGQWQGDVHIAQWKKRLGA